MQLQTIRKRAVFALGVPIALLALFLLGRRAASSATALDSGDGSTATSSAASNSAAALDVAGALGAASSAASADASVAASGDAAVGGDGGDTGDTSAASAVEYLADGAVVVDINRASEDELRKLPGIGPGRARSILALRARLGRFRSVDDLARVKGLGRGALRKIRPFVRVS